MALRALERASGTIAERPTGSPCSLLAARALRRMRPSSVPGAPAEGPVRAELVALDGAGERFELRLRIAPDHHVQAHEPGVEGLLGIDATPRDDGVRIDAAWPVGEMDPSGARVHRGSVTVPIRLLSPLPAPRPLRLAVRWQCCTARECRAPQSVQLEG